MTKEKKLHLINRVIDELEMALADAKDARDDIEGDTYEHCSLFHAKEAASLWEGLREG